MLHGCQEEVGDGLAWPGVGCQSEYLGVGGDAQREPFEALREGFQGDGWKLRRHGWISFHCVNRYSSPSLWSTLSDTLIVTEPLTKVFHRSMPLAA